MYLCLCLVAASATGPLPNMERMVYEVRIQHGLQQHISLDSLALQVEMDTPYPRHPLCWARAMLRLCLMLASSQETSQTDEDQSLQPGNKSTTRCKSIPMARDIDSSIVSRSVLTF